MLKRILAYGGHLFAATFVAFWLSIWAERLLFDASRPFLAPTSTAQQFLSDHLIFLAFVVGASLAYSVSGTFPSKSALWVWIPAAAVFALRVLNWRESGSVLSGPGSFVEHFFTANCQIENWRELDFASRCFDRLYVTRLFAGSLAYSAGAAIRRVIHYHSPAREIPATSVLAVPGQLQIVTTPFTAILALALALSFLGNQFHAEIGVRPSSWQWLGSGSLSTWVVVTINSGMWGGMCLLGIGFARGPFRKDEKVFLTSFIGGVVLSPVAALLPRTSRLVQIAQTVLSLATFVAALAILLSFWNDRPSSRPPENG